MNRKERRNLQRQGVQVPKDPTLNIKLSALGKSIMTPEMQMAMRRWMPRSTLSSRSSSLSLRKAALSWRPALSSGTARQGGFLDDNHHNDLQALRAHPCH